jgi:hypothetical protein
LIVVSLGSSFGDVVEGALGVKGAFRFAGVPGDAGALAAPRRDKHSRFLMKRAWKAARDRERLAGALQARDLKPNNPH